MIASRRNCYQSLYIGLVLQIKNKNRELTNENICFSTLVHCEHFVADRKHKFAVLHFK